MVLNNDCLVPLTDSTARKHLKAISIVLGVQPLITYTFRKGGTTWSFQHGVPIQEIMQYGT